jgi:integrase
VTVLCSPIEMDVWAPEVAALGARRRESPTIQAYADPWLTDRKTKARELRATTRRQYRMLLDKFIDPTFGDERIDRISTDDVNAWYDALAPGRETIRPQSYSLPRTIFAGDASERPTPLIPYNPAHIGALATTSGPMQPARLEELRIIVEELPDRYRLMALLAAWCAMRFGELAELRPHSRRVCRAACGDRPLSWRSMGSPWDRRLG